MPLTCANGSVVVVEYREAAEDMTQFQLIRKEFHLQFIGCAFPVDVHVLGFRADDVECVDV